MNMRSTENENGTAVEGVAHILCSEIGECWGKGCGGEHLSIFYFHVMRKFRNSVRPGGGNTIVKLRRI